jgi:hypothetical protein
MVDYSKVSDEKQLTGSRRRKQPTVIQGSVEPAELWVDMTTTIPESVRQDVRVACAIHGVKLKDAVTEALRAWLMEHPASTR